MIINGGSRSNGGFFGRHLMRTDHNDRVAVIEIRGLAAETIRDAFREMKLVASGTRCTNYFYHANINTRVDEVLSMEQWALAADTLERQLGLTDQPRFVVEHEKDGRTHRHIVWSRINADSMTAISDSLTYPKHERAARELEQSFGHDPVDSVLVKDRDTSRPDRNPQDWESLRAQDSKLDPKAIKAEVTALWQAADSGAAFAAALEDRGYILARGDRRDFCIIDTAGDEHSLARRIAGVKAAAIRERMADIDREMLPSVAEGRELARLRQDAAGEGGRSPADPVADPADLPAEDAQATDEQGAVSPIPPAEEPTGLDVIHAQLVAKMQPEDPGLAMFLPEQKPAENGTTLDAVHNRNIVGAIADQRALDREEAAAPGSRFERIRAWWGHMREQFNDWRGYLQERIDHFRGHAETEPTQPATPPPQPEIEPDL